MTLQLTKKELHRLVSGDLDERFEEIFNDIPFYHEDYVRSKGETHRSYVDGNTVGTSSKIPRLVSNTPSITRTTRNGTTTSPIYRKASRLSKSQYCFRKYRWLSPPQS
jgi:hypothetical protein